MRLISFIVTLASILFVTQPTTLVTAGVVSSNVPARCGQWLMVLNYIQASIFDNGRCNDQARGSIRLTFHDAIGRSLTLQSDGSFGGGGADGSIIKFADTELADPANIGLKDIVLTLKDVADRHGVSYGDIIQFAGAVGLSNCPGSPPLAFHAGRPEAVAPSPPGLIPSPTDSVGIILARMADAGFTAEETVALLAAHSVARQKTIDPRIPNAPLDSTPEVFDAQFYLEMLLKAHGHPGKGVSRNPSEVESPVKGVVRLASDDAIAQHNRTACIWQSSAGSSDFMRVALREAMKKLANQGHNNLVDCSFIIPTPAPWSQRPTLPSNINGTMHERLCDRTTTARMSPLK